MKLEAPIATCELHNFFHLITPIKFRDVVTFRYLNLLTYALVASWFQDTPYEDNYSLPKR